MHKVPLNRFYKLEGTHRHHAYLKTSNIQIPDNINDQVVINPGSFGFLLAIKLPKKDIQTHYYNTFRYTKYTLLTEQGLIVLFYDESSGPFLSYWKEIEYQTTNE